MPSDTRTELHGVPVLICAADGPDVAGQDAVLDLIGAALGAAADWVALPAHRLPDSFFTLRTGVAGEVTQKFVNYRIGLAVVGDIAVHLARSPALRDFVAESNRGRQLWFVADQDALAHRLSSGNGRDQALAGA